jgi:hypothetical protein
LKKSTMSADCGDRLVRGVIVFADQSAEKAEPRLAQIRLRRLAGAMAECDVGHLVGHDSGQLTFILGRLDEAAVHVEVSARQCKRVDVGDVDDLELVRVLRPRRDRREALADSVDVSFDRLIVEYRQLLLGGVRGLSTDLLILLRGEKIEPRLDLSLRGPGASCQRRQRRETQRDDPCTRPLLDHVLLRTKCWRRVANRRTHVCSSAHQFARRQLAERLIGPVESAARAGVVPAMFAGAQTTAFSLSILRV